MSGLTDLALTTLATEFSQVTQDELREVLLAGIVAAPEGILPVAFSAAHTSGLVIVTGVTGLVAEYTLTLAGLDVLDRIGETCPACGGRGGELVGDDFVAGVEWNPCVVCQSGIGLL